MPVIAWPTVRALVLELIAAVALAALGTWLWHPVWTPLCMIAVGTRQHALGILFHDAVHGLLARPQRLNDAIVNALAGVPMLFPVHAYRALHLVHHKQLGTEGDPERTLLYAGQDWNYQPLPARRLARQLLGDLLLWNNVRTSLEYARERARPRRIRLPSLRVYPELYAMFAVLAGGFAAGALVSPLATLHAAVVWFVPLLTVTQFIHKLRSFAEHAGPDAAEASYSWRPGLLGRLTLWPYNIQYHREHHAHPNVPWYELPTRFPERNARPGRTLPAILWDGTW